MKHPSQLKAEQIRNRHLARQFPHVGQIIAERDAYKKALEDAGIPLPEADVKDITKPAVPAPSEAPSEPVEETPTEPAATGEGWEETTPDAAPKKTAKKTAKK